MSIAKHISFFTAAVFFLCSCQKNIDVFVPDPGQLNGPDTTWYSSISDAMPVAALRGSLSPETIKTGIEIGMHIDSATTANGLTCIFPAAGYTDAAGNTITGKITSEVLLLKKKGDMIRANRPTVSGDRMLVSTAAVFVQLKKDTQNILLAPAAQLKLKITDAGNAANTAFFYGEESAGGKFNWLENNDPANNFIAASVSPLQVTTNKLRWTGCAYFFDTANITRNRVSVTLPSNYTNANTMVYVVFKDLRSVIALTADVTLKKFTSIGLPDNKAVTVIAISRQANDYYLGTSSFTTGAAANNTSFTPVKSSLAAINTALDNL